MPVNEIEATVYKLKRFTSSSDKDFVKALKIYIENTDPNIVISTNEICHGVDFYNERFTDADFTAVGLYLNKVLIGYCQFVYFKEEQLVFIDYLVIEKNYRGNNTFYSFIEKIREYFDVKSYYPSYFVTEVSLQGAMNESEYTSKTRNLIRLLKMNNFGVIGSPYFQPMLGLSNYESNLQAVLMLYPAEEHRVIKKETFLMMLKTIYFKHYERWYTMVALNEKDTKDYSLHLYDLFGKINEKLKNTPSIKLNSYSDTFYEKGVSKPERAPKKVLYFLVGFVALIAFLGVIAFLLRSVFKMEYKDQFYFLISVSVLYLMILSIFSDKASKILNKALEKGIDKVT